MSAETVNAISAVLALYAHVVDDGRGRELERVFSADAVLTSGERSFVGLDAIRAFLFEEAPRRTNPTVAHHTTNSVISVGEDERSASVRSKVLTIKQDLTVAPGVYEDTLIHGPAGWRIRSRTVRKWSRW